MVDLFSVLKYGLSWLACLLAGVCVYVWWVWCGWVAGRAVLGDTAVHLPGRTWGHRTQDDDLCLILFLQFCLQTLPLEICSSASKA